MCDVAELANPHGPCTLFPVMIISGSEPYRTARHRKMASLFSPLPPRDVESPRLSRWSRRHPAPPRCLRLALHLGIIGLLAAPRCGASGARERKRSTEKIDSPPLSINDAEFARAISLPAHGMWYASTAPAQDGLVQMDGGTQPATAAGSGFLAGSNVKSRRDESDAAAANSSSSSSRTTSTSTTPTTTPAIADVGEAGDGRVSNSSNSSNSTPGAGVTENEGDPKGGQGEENSAGSGANAGGTTTPAGNGTVCSNIAPNGYTCLDGTCPPLPRLVHLGNKIYWV